MATFGLTTRGASKLTAEPARMPALKPRAQSAIHALPSFSSSAGNMAIQRLAADPSHSHSGPVLLQRKLTIGSVDDPLEHEADHIAEHVMRMPAQVEPIGSNAAQVQRKCACGGTCDSCKTDEEQRTVHRKPAARPQIAAGSSAATTAMNAPPIVHEVLSSPGQPLGTTERAFMEPRFGQDFSGVRVHTGAKAAESAAAMQARAYTVGNNIVFGGKESASDLPVLAHELTHVVQQSGASPALQRLAYCADFLERTPRPGVRETRVRDSLLDEAALFGTVEKEFVIPAASFGPWRDEPQRIDWVIKDPDNIQGDGKADIALLIGSTQEVIEVKEATWDGGLEAEKQLRNYLNKADDDLELVTELWRKRGHAADTITRVEAMPMNRLNLDPRLVDGVWVELGWCDDGLIVFRPYEEEEPEDEEPKDEEPKEKEPKDSEPGPSPIPSLPELAKLGAKLLALLAADGLLSAALSLVGPFLVALTPLLALAALAVGIVFLWDKIKSVAQAIGGAVQWVWDKISFVVGAIKDAIKELGIKIGELAVFVGGLIKDIAEMIAEGLLRAGRAVISGAKWLGGKIAEGAEAVWDWLFGDDVEPMYPVIEMPHIEEPTMHCGTVAREDALIQMNSDLLFPFGKWKLEDMGNDTDKAKAEAVLKDAAAKVLSTPRVSDEPIRFLGYTDVIGEDVDNERLSKLRAEAVADWFVQHNVILRSKVQITGFGETQAQAKANDEKGRKKDRRVDILVTKKGSTEKVCW